MTEMNAWEAIAKSLKEEGSKYIFGIPGVSQLFDPSILEPEIKPILTRHEASGVFMAMAYARLTGEPGICHGVRGPGVANMVPGILEAYTGCMPVIAPCPHCEETTEFMGGLLDFKQVETFAPITKWSVRISMPEKTPWVMRRAFSLAVNGRPGPVFIEVPLDVGSKKVEMVDYVRSRRPLRSRGDPDDINEAVNLLLKAERPVVVAGGGVVLSKACNELIQLAEMLAMPVLTTASGRGVIPEDHPLACGLVGIYRTKIGKAVYDEADILLTVGSELEGLESGCFNYFPKEAKFIQVNIDPFSIGRNFIPDVPIVGDAKLVLRDLIEGVKERVRKEKLESMPRIKGLVKAKKEYEAAIEAECMTATVRTKRVVRTLSKVFGKDTILSNENGAQDLWSYYFPYYKVLNIGDCMGMPNQTCMGLGVVSAIAAKIVRPDKKVVCTTGDGAFQMFMKELPTAVQYHAPVTYAIMNNFCLEWPKFGAKAAGIERAYLDFEVQPDFAKIAEANKCYGERIDRAEDIEPAIRNALKANEEGAPAVLDFILSQPFDYNEYFIEWGKNYRAPTLP